MKWQSIVSIVLSLTAIVISAVTIVRTRRASRRLDRLARRP